MKMRPFLTFFEENEWIQANRLNQHVERPVERVAEKYAIYYVYLSAPGISLEEYVAQHSILFCTSLEELKDEFLRLREIMISVFRVMQYLWRNKSDNVDIHAKNFFVDDNGRVTLIDLETLNLESYDIRTTAYWIDSMKFDSQRVKDIRRIGLLYVYLLGEANLYTDSMTAPEIIELTEVILKPLLSIEKLHELLYEMLVQKDPDERRILILLTELRVKPAVLQERSLEKKSIDGRRQNFSDFVEILRAKTNPSNMEHILLCALSGEEVDVEGNIKKLVIRLDSLSTGLDGIAGLLILCSTRYKEYGSYISACGDEIRKRLIVRRKSKLILMYRDSSYVSPYISDGVSGIIFAYTLLPEEYWPTFLVEICESIAKPYAKSFDYFHGLLGITDTILDVGLKMRDKDLVTKGMLMLDQLKSISNISKSKLPMTKYVGTAEKITNQHIFMKLISRFKTMGTNKSENMF